MARSHTTTITTNFQSGELDPLLRGQKDLDAYKNGAKKLRNVQHRATGGMEKRFGTLDLGFIADPSRLEPFEFSADQRYVIIFRPGSVTYCSGSGAIIATIGGAPWDATTMWEMSTSQLGDVMVICHRTFPTQVLTRTGISTFTLGAFAFAYAPDDSRQYQPFYKFVAPEITLTPSGAGGAITLTAKDKAGNPAAIWTADHVGLRVRLYDADAYITGIVSSSVVNATVLAGLKGKLDLDPFKTTKGSVDVEVLHLFHGLTNGKSITLSGANDCGGIPGNFFNGTFVINALDEHRYKITLTGVNYHYWEDPDGDGTPTSNAYTAARTSEDGGGPNVEFSIAGTATRAWLEPAFSAVVGYPGACCFHENRLWFGGSESQPDGQWGSNALEFFKFDVGKGYDSDSIQVAIGTEDVSRTRHLISNGELIALNANGAHAFRVRDGEPITPSNARVKGISDAGSSRVQPVVFDGAVVYTSENGLAVFEVATSQGGAAADTVAVSVLAGHLIRVPNSIAATRGLAGRAEAQCFFTNSDGTIAVFHSDRQEKVAGWTLWELGGGAKAISGCAIGGYLFLCVLVRGQYRLYRVDASAWLDGAVIHTSGVATANWTLAPLVRGRTVALVSELGYHGEVAIPADGVIVLDRAVTTLQAGDAFYPTIELLPPQVQLATGPQDGVIKRVVCSITDFGDDSQSVVVNGYTLPTSSQISPVTSPFQVSHLGCVREPTLVFTQAAPLPKWRVLGVVREVVIG